MSLPERIEAAIDERVRIACWVRDHVHIGSSEPQYVAEQVLCDAEVSQAELHALTHSDYDPALLPILLGRLAARYGVSADG